MSNRALSTLLTAILIMISGVANAASTTNQGALPNGKPFKQIQLQFTSMQEEINSWIKNVIALQGTVAGLQGSITTLQGTMATLQGTVGTIQANMIALQDRILLAESAIAYLRTQVALYQTQIATLSANITLNADQIASLQSLVDHINMVSIPGLQSEINAISDSLTWKQDILQGRCPEGQALSAIDPNGTITCMTPGGAKTTVISFVDLNSTPDNSMGGKATAFAACPRNYSLTGGGYHVSSPSIFIDSAGFDAANAQQWMVSANSSSKTPFSIFATAICAKAN